MRIEAEGDFELIASALTGQKISINSENAHFIFLMAADLGIEFLMKATNEFIYSTLTPQKAIELIECLLQVSQYDGPQIQYMAVNFESMKSIREFKALPTHILASILHHPQLNITSIENYCQWLIGFCSQDPEKRSGLLQFIKFDNQSRFYIKNLLEGSDVNVNLIRTPLLNMLRNGLTQRQANDVEVVDCKQKPNKPDYGVFAMMCERCSGNPQDFNMVKVTCNSTLQNIIDPSWTSWWSTPNEQGSWVEFDFQQYRLRPNKYTLKTIFADVKLPYMRSWRIDGSDDEVHWELLNEQRNSNTGTESKTYHTWDIITDKQFRYIRLTQIDKNGSDNYCLFIHDIEFFGTLSMEGTKVELNKEEGKDWKGVFDYLSQKCNRANPVEKGIIAIKSSCDPKFLLEKSWNGCWRSPKVPNSWVQIELINTELILTSYSLRTHYGPAHIRSWEVEVSKDGEEWYLVDQRINRDEYKEPYANLHWICTEPQTDPMKFIRFKMTGPSTRNEWIFWLSNIELFGDIFRHK
ncbi:hypothetical protein TVAG_359640 [Trichomonas vaginalis G3]|uniref:F5/8 type C domain containing protein n=1 Tax=Trichomonas vaginalis (strain ATCC PRA-98 / G3) TaxID=412133 RepID=A2DT83_TRIV3|nr:galactose binding-like domain superfamily [Trichomonas vaginalis G3]EAY16355.1 hypothetical protein TVAG_359640 [Trichomonas vaginalis G3]KAI5488415.1 galactose binding-like domain superfamily [Trichomonas vaginalis G3]|eukprot:XP_001328578.1 hypothetical protein [Trichomonas vaginalis G3]